MHYTKEKLEINQRSRCGNCDEYQPAILVGKPQIKGNKLLLHSLSNPSQITAELDILPGDVFTYKYQPFDEPLLLRFEREEEPTPWRRLLLRLGFPPSLIP